MDTGKCGTGYKTSDMQELKHVKGSVITKVNTDFKNSHRFSDGTTIRLERDRNRFDKNYTTISQGEVVDAEYIPAGATIFFHHNASHEMYRIYNYKTISGGEIASNIQYFSIPEDQCYLWRIGEGPAEPLRGFVTALRVFKPYTGVIHGIEPAKLKNTLYITSGKLKGQVVRTLKACDYEIIFNNLAGVEERVVRCRHWDYSDEEREEIVAIDNGATKKVNAGELHIGLTVTDCKPLKSLQNAST
jgi:hypothetical protein